MLVQVVKKMNDYRSRVDAQAEREAAAILQYREYQSAFAPNTYRKNPTLAEELGGKCLKGMLGYIKF